MKVTSLELQGLKLIELKVHGDHRGFFVERFNEREFLNADLPIHYVQDNHSRSAPRVLRGLHFQRQPAQGKLVGVSRGRIWDIAVDIRPNSPTFGQSYGLELSDMNGKLLWVPPGFAHGFCVLGDESADVMYKVDGFYNPQEEDGIIWNDSELNIQWPIQDPIISSRDEKLLSFREFKDRSC